MRSPGRIAIAVWLITGVGTLALPAIGAAAVTPDGPRLVPAPGPVLPVPPAADPGIHLSSLPAGRVPAPGRRTGTYTARILTPTVVRRRPAGRRIWLARTWARWSGGGQRLMVLGSRSRKGRQWLRVRLPIRPNHTSGWLPRDRVTLAHSPAFLRLDLSRRRLTYFGRQGHRRTRFRVVVGKHSTPTPTGLFALYDRVRQRDPRGFSGPWVLPLTAHSNRLRKFDGGPGLVALHGRDGASLFDPLGSARSHGCVRMSNGRIRNMARLQLGTAIRIRR